MGTFIRYDKDPHTSRNDRQNIKRMLPFLWEYRGRVLLALACLVGSKLAIVGVPFVLKEIIDTLDFNNTAANSNLLILPLALLIAYGALRLAGNVFNELRDALFARVRYRAIRRVSTRVLKHLHHLSLSYHIERKTGGISRDLDRGTRSISTILNYLIFNILPTMAEFSLVAIILLSKYDINFTIAVFSTVCVYVAFTLMVTEWRMHFRHEMNASDSEANNKAVDSLLNYETVKYFTNEEHELKRYDETLNKWENSAVKSQTSMSLLNFGQGSIITVGVTIIMIFAAQGVVDQELTLGDLVLVNALMLQLFIPLGFLGIVYRQLKYSLADMDLMFKLLGKSSDVVDDESAKQLLLKQGNVSFNKVSFSYQPEREILKNVSFDIPAGKKVAVVGPSGAGKSTLSRLLFRFYETTSGSISIDEQNIKSLTQESLRQAIGIVPQDTVLFNESIFYNIKYAKPNATKEEVIAAAKTAYIHDFIESLPNGYDSIVGERGLKLSGGEKQRVAIARVVLKNPKILVFDEATSSLDSHSEQTILKALSEVAQQHTVLVIAHRLSTVVDSDIILVMEKGQIVERGTHSELIKSDGFYAKLWRLQLEEPVK